MANRVQGISHVLLTGNSAPTVHIVPGKRSLILSIEPCLSTSETREYGSHSSCQEPHYADGSPGF